MINPDEALICEIANSIPKVKARLAKKEEDYGSRKADVIVKYNGKTFYFQVSHQDKSKKMKLKLIKIGTIPISTHRFLGIPKSSSKIKEEIKEAISHS